MMWKRSALGTTVRLCFLLLVWAVSVGRAIAIPDLRFDVVTFCCYCANTMCQTQFDHLNFPTTNGHYIAMGSDTYRTNLLSNGNLLAIYYNNFDSDYSTNVTAAQEATTIDQYATSLFTTTGPRPNWLVLNEISSGLWPTSQTYRTWVENVVQLLNTNYGFTVMVYAPFATPANNNADWQAIAACAYIGVENYLSGQEIQSEGFSVSWCQGQYQSSITNYTALGVPTSRLILGENFAQTLANTSYGRSGISSNNWISAISARDQAALNAGFPGFIGYAWGGDDLDVSTNEMVRDEDIYAANLLPTSGALTLPYPAWQPQSLVAPPGSTVAFDVFPAGDAPTTYQWSFNGNILPGSTSSVLTLTNIGPTNAGSYAVLLSNAVGKAWSSNALLTVQVPPPISYEPFADATASGGTSYAAGANLIGQMNAQGLTWFQAGPNSGLGNQPVLQAGNLVVPGLAFPEGNSVRFGGNGVTARLEISTNTGITSGTLYYSLAMKLTNITSLSSSGVFWAGFNNSTGSQTTTPSAVATRIYTRAASGGFNLGLSKASSTNTDWVWDTTVHHTNETIFVVGSYTFNTSRSTDDVANLWINPPVAMYGTANPPAPTLVASSGSDMPSSIIASFLIMNRDATEPAGGVVDEVRIGSSWSSVTPPSGPWPTLTIVQSGGNAIITWPTNATGFYLRSSPTLASSSAWTNVPQTIYSVGGQYTVTNPLSPGTKYFRLQQP